MPSEHTGTRWYLTHDHNDERVLTYTPHFARESVVGWPGGESAAGIPAFEEAANARLMAAAPQMYSSLEAIEFLLSIDLTDTERRVLLRTVVQDGLHASDAPPPPECGFCFANPSGEGIVRCVVTWAHRVHRAATGERFAEPTPVGPTWVGQPDSNPMRTAGLMSRYLARAGLAMGSAAPPVWIDLPVEPVGTVPESDWSPIYYGSPNP